MDLLPPPPEIIGQKIEEEEVHIATHTEIIRRASNELSYNDFYWQYMHSNWPVLLTGVSTDWECRRLWTLPRPTEDVDNNRRPLGSINFDYLRRCVRNRNVPVADCNTEYYNSHAKIEMRLHDFLSYWQAKVRAEEAGVEENSNSSTDDIQAQPPCITANETTSTTTDKNLYLKDWHLRSQEPDYEFYRVPKHFASDWLNEALVSSGRDDYRFVYMGPKDTWTPFHADVFGSYSWSTNIVGCKKWILLPPGEELKLNDKFRTLPLSIDETLLQQKNVRFFTLLQGENEALFVPSGWYHQVWNLSDTISVNHNWFNACNVEQIWRNLSSNMQQVRAEVNDCRDMDNFDDHCQMMLRASFGINYLDFLDTLEFIVAQRLRCCDNGNGGEAASATSTALESSNFYDFDKFTPNNFHLRYDLRKIRIVLELMLQDTVICDSRTVLYRKCLEILELMKGF